MAKRRQPERWHPGADIIERPKEDNAKFVAPLPRAEIVESEPVHLPEAATGGSIRTTSHVEGSYTDRAWSFSVATWQLSTVVGIAAWLLSAHLISYPLLSITGLLWVISGYLAVWFASYLIHVFVSPEGIELFHVAMMWRYLNREQKERLKRYQDK